MALIAIDSTDTGFEWTSDGHSRQTAADLDAVLSSLTEPHVFICWTSFYSCDRHERDWLADTYLAPMGHSLVGISGRAAAALSAACGESDVSDVLALHAVAAGGSNRLDRAVALDRDPREIGDALSVAHSIALGGGIAIDAEWAREVLGPFAGLDASRAVALGDGHDYSPPLLDAISRAARVFGSRKEFEAMLVPHAGPVTNPLARTVRDRYVALVHGESGTYDRNEYRSALRFAYGMLHRDRMHRESTPLVAHDVGFAAA